MLSEGRASTVLLLHAVSVSRRLDKLADTSELSWLPGRSVPWHCLLSQCETILSMPVTQRDDLHIGKMWSYFSSTRGDISSKRLVDCLHHGVDTDIFFDSYHVLRFHLVHCLP
ncbi:hypothetical protein ARMGADRAFT_485604 [Armillaria gallica]|uniref:Uncharacterized protein n=1 Tax=Armillaria gallica TaxID=47427 RepID=A0A2H3E5L2_ARMGA|nr:hypothetical protein ARMGADRAFT_485604 [Armillaria gallica]